MTLYDIWKRSTCNGVCAPQILSLFVGQQIHFLCGPYGIVILGLKTLSFKKNNKVDVSILGVWFFDNL